MLTLLLMTCLNQGAIKPQKAYVIPVVIEDESDPRTFMKGIKQIEIDRDLLYVRPSNSTEVLVFDRQLKFLFSVGGKGGGPGKFKVNLAGFSVRDSSLWLFEDDHRLSYFQGPDHIRDIPIKGLQVSYPYFSTVKFDFDDHKILLSAHPRTRNLGLVYDFEGNILQGVGNLFPINREVLQKNPAYNDVLWVKGSDSWYAIFEYHPLIQKFDANFLLVDEIAYSAQAHDDYLDHFGDWKPKKKWRIPPEINTDAKWHDGHLWVMCFGALLKIDPNGKRLTREWHFFGKGENFPEMERLHFYSFDSFSDDFILITTIADQWGSYAFTFDLNK